MPPPESVRPEDRLKIIGLDELEALTQDAVANRDTVLVEKIAAAALGRADFYASRAPLYDKEKNRLCRVFTEADIYLLNQQLDHP